MVRSQIRPSNITNQKLLHVMRVVPRHEFIPEKLEGIAYMDNDIPLGHDRHMLRPTLLAQMIEAANIDATDTVLDIGCSMGYSAAVLAGVARKVIAIEVNGELSSKANYRLHSLHIENAIIISGNLPDGHPEGAPYDIIFINGAVEHIPDTLINQLANGGRLVTIQKTSPAMGQLVLLTRQGNDITTCVIDDANADVLPGFEKLVNPTYDSK